MTKDKFNAAFREYARTLSPRIGERDLISDIYGSFKELLGENNCLQIGSYPRFTAITPVHDLDILYFLGTWDEAHHDPTAAIESLRTKIENDYVNPTDFTTKVSLQTHSVTVVFLMNGGEEFAVDIVPAYIHGKNEFNDDMYMVPEIVKRSHRNRVSYYEELSKQNRQMGWLASDPRGYITVASNVDEETKGEFRKTAKLIKKWKDNLVDADDSLKLKSFHLEQIATKYFIDDSEMEIFDVIFKFFVDLPKIIDKPNQIRDRANEDKFIDDYLEKFTSEQKQKIKAARDSFLIKLENFSESSTVEKLLEINFHPRVPSEKFLFDFGVKTLTNNALVLEIDGFVKQTPGFSAGWITESPQLQKGISSGGTKTRKIKFETKKDRTGADAYWWKVKNSNDSKEPRGEITAGGTKSNPESTAFPSKSYVECYALINRVCVAKARVNVNII